MKIGLKKCVVAFFSLVMAPTFAAGILIEAESHIGTGGGTVKKATDRPRTSGGIVLTHWNDAGHWLEWSFQAAEAGDYKVMLRYATGREWRMWRELKLDGQTPEGFAKFELAYTGGFGRNPQEWHNQTVSQAGKPLTLKLSKGRHVLRLTNLGGQGEDGAANLDAIVLFSAPTKPESMLNLKDK